MFCVHEGCSLPEVLITSFLPLQFFVFVRLLRVQFSDPYKNVGKTKVLYIFKIVFVLTFLKIIFLIVPSNCENCANLDSLVIAILIEIDDFHISFFETFDDFLFLALSGCLWLFSERVHTPTLYVIVKKDKGKLVPVQEVV